MFGAAGTRTMFATFVASVMDRADRSLRCSRRRKVRLWCFSSLTGGR